MNYVLKSCYYTLMSSKYSYWVDSKRKYLYANFNNFFSPYKYLRSKLIYDDFGSFMIEHCVRVMDER